MLDIIVEVFGTLPENGKLGSQALAVLGFEVDCTFGHLAWQCQDPELVQLRFDGEVSHLCAQALDDAKTNPLWIRALEALPPVDLPPIGS